MKNTAYTASNSSWTPISAGHVMQGASLQVMPKLFTPGRELRAERERAGFSLEAVGKEFRTGVSRERIRQLEKSPRVSVSATQAFRAAIKAAKLRREKLNQVIAKVQVEFQKVCES